MVEPGDRVKIVGSGYKFEGQVGTVMKADLFWEWRKVQLDNMEYPLTIYARHLQVIPAIKHANEILNP